MLFQLYQTMHTWNNSKGGNDSLHCSEYDEAFQELAAYVQASVFDQLDVFYMSALRSRFAEQICWSAFAEKCGKLWLPVRKVEGSSTERIGERISFWHPQHCSQAELVYFDEVLKGQIIEAGLTPVTADKDDSCDNDDDDRPGINSLMCDQHIQVYHTAKIVCSALWECE